MSPFQRLVSHCGRIKGLGYFRKARNPQPEISRRPQKFSYLLLGLRMATFWAALRVSYLERAGIPDRRPPFGRAEPSSWRHNIRMWGAAGASPLSFKGGASAVARRRLSTSWSGVESGCDSLKPVKYFCNAFPKTAGEVLNALGSQVQVSWLVSLVIGSVYIQR